MFLLPSGRSRAAVFAALVVATAPAVARAQDPPPPKVPSGEPAPPPPATTPAPDTPAPRPYEPPPLPTIEEAVAPPSAPPAASMSPTDRDGARSLKGHTFPFPQVVDRAFLATTFGLGLELGKQTTNGFTPASPTPSYDQHLGFIVGHLDLGFAFASRFEADLDATYSAFLGSDDNTVLRYGGLSGWEIRPGVRVRLVRSAATGTELGVHVYGRFGAGSRLDPLDAKPPTTMHIGNTSAGAGAAVAVAQSLGARFGVQGSAGLDVGWSNVTTGSSEDLATIPISAHIGVAPSLDLAPLPVSLVAEYRFLFTFVPAASPSPTARSFATMTFQHQVIAGAWYTGRRDLQLGVSFHGTFATSTDTDDTGATYGQPAPSALSGTATVRYFF